MAKYLTILLVVFCTAGFAQTTSCSDLIYALEREAGYGDTFNAIGSSAIAKAVRYTFEGQGSVIIYFKRNDFDFNGTPYVFCDISSTRWSYFKSAGNTGSWGKAYNDYIKEYECNCN
jgi:hypothetical protein